MKKIKIYDVLNLLEMEDDVLIFDLDNNSSNEFQGKVKDVPLKLETSYVVTSVSFINDSKTFIYVRSK